MISLYTKGGKVSVTVGVASSIANDVTVRMTSYLHNENVIMGMTSQ